MKRKLRALAAVFILVLACAGCAGTEEAPPPEPVQEVQKAPVENSPADASPAETEDHVLSTLEATVSGGRVLRLEVIEKKRADMDQWGVREVRVYDGDTLVQTVLTQEAIDAGGVDGVDEGYTDCWSAEEAAAVQDMNFDGYDDLDLFGWCCNNTIPHYYWLWDADTEQYRYAFTLQGVKVDTDQKEITSEYKATPLYCTDHYHCDAAGNLTLLQREITDYSRGTPDEPLQEVYDVIDGQMVLRE